jgi:hypothetical protein
VILAIVLASSSFALLTSAVATSKLEVQGTVAENYRAAYDILVRPATSKESEAGTAARLERSQGLVQANYLSGIYGGISMDQLDQIRDIAGVEVAAPVAMIGYTLPAVDVPVVINDLIEDDPTATDQLFRLTRTWSTDRGLTSIPAATSYQYFTRRSLKWQAANAEQPPSFPAPRPLTSPCWSASGGRRPRRLRATPSTSSGWGISRATGRTHPGPDANGMAGRRATSGSRPSTGCRC